MIRPLRYSLVLAGLVLAVTAPATVTAASFDECQATIDAIGDATAAATFNGKQAAKEQAGLLRKLEGASEALAAGKVADTVQKLTDFRSHAVTIGQAGKLDPVDAARLAQLVDDAIACVGAIGT